MRLTALNLQGFKSFPDRASFVVGDGLTGVVGPNGCGKSNLIDAVRWGLGESRAASLRGGALQDVLFSGTDDRAAADWCVVEMRFVADEGDDLGMWSAFEDIIVRRELGRDGQSHFHINEQSVRRRDVVDLFRGTGVSPRSYAVVEQGMVGAIAEASPDSLRQFLEEAAGVSHYKDRRREAERRLAGCAGNLEELGRLLEDLRRRREALKRQARAAQRHREMSARINDLEALIILDHRAAAEAKLVDKRQVLSVLDGELKIARKRLDALRERGEQARAQYGEWAKRAQTLRANWARAQSAAERARQDLAQAGDKRAQLQARWAAETAELEDTRRAVTECAGGQKEGAEELSGIGGTLEACITAAERSADEMERLQQSLHECEQVMEAARGELAAAQQRREAVRLERQMMEEQQKTLAAHLDSLQSAKNKLTMDDDESAPPTPAAAQQRLAECEAAIVTAAGDCRDLAAELETAQAAARAGESVIVGQEAEYAALESLAREGEWDGGKRLADVLRLRAGEWAAALDAALGRCAGGYVVESIDDILAQGVPPAGTALVEVAAAAAPPPSSRADWPTLLSHIEASSEGSRLLATWLAGVYTADSEAEARSRRHELAAGEMMVTREGLVFTRESLLVHGEAQGGFVWQRRLAELTAAVAEERQKLTVQQKQIEELQGRQTEREAARTEAEAAAEAARAELLERRVVWSQWEERRRAAAERRREIAEELSAGEARLDEIRAAAAETAAAEQAEEECVRRQEAVELARGAESRVTAEVEKCREHFHQLSAERRELHLREENLRQQIKAADARREELRRREESLQTGIAQIESDLAGLDESSLRERERRDVAAVATTEKEAQAAEKEAAALEARAEAAAAERERELAAVEQRREKHAAWQVEEKELALRVEGLDNSLEELSVNREQLLTLAEASMTPAERQAEIDALSEKRQRLGGINFAADSELSEVSERLEKMESDRLDVENAVSELQTTMRRIDTETRSKLRDTFNLVNADFDRLFKRLFNGGEAVLAMEGDSVLDGVFEVRAKPPGKRLFPVRMLSGGEKSATALAFIFALMERALPPFCVMDEVDAALDDMRVDSFLSLLSDLSQRFQCLVVTHNKATIESMDALIGVTQEEKGVSKMVAVTLDDALRALND